MMEKKQYSGKTECIVQKDVYAGSSRPLTRSPIVYVPQKAPLHQEALQILLQLIRGSQIHL